MNLKAKQQLLKVFKTLRDQGPRRYRDGICHNARIIMREEFKDEVVEDNIVSHVSGAAERWSGYDPKYHAGYPVEGSPHFYNRYANKWTGSNGERRKDLLAFLIKDLEQNLEQEIAQTC
ncbi:hypothetical protein D3C78_885800 [compost metagenome]